MVVAAIALSAVCGVARALAVRRGSKVVPARQSSPALRPQQTENARAGERVVPPAHRRASEAAPAAMARGRLMAMPLLVANMGGEMIYILEQRLRAQSISPSKASKGEQARPRPRPRRRAMTVAECPPGMARRSLSPPARPQLCWGACVSRRSLGLPPRARGLPAGCHGLSEPARRAVWCSLGSRTQCCAMW